MKNCILLFLILFALSACGGGGGGGGAGSSVSSATNWTATKCTTSYTDSNGVKIPCAYQTFNTTQNSTTGSYTSSNYTGYGAFSWTLGSDALLYGTLPSRTISGNYTAPVTHLTDTGAATAWAQGWTGTGTNIYIIDDHSDKDIIIDLGTNTVSNIAVTDREGFSYESIGTYNVSYRNSTDVSHGWLVKNIAGGDKRTDTTHTVDITHTSTSEVSCVYSSNATGSNTPGESSNKCLHDTYTSYFADYTLANASMILTPGVAKDSSMVEASVDLNANYEVTIAQLQSHVDNSINQDVANLSLGIAMPSGETWASIKSAMDAYAEGVFSWNKGTRTIKPVYVISAGNNGVGCAAGEMVQCNYLAALALLDPDIGGQTIIAGATTTDGGKKIATYSNRAGVMMDRYLLASGDTGFYLLNGTHVRGTSFSAPRISGAAALLKSKFPNLSGANVSDILLLTADKDIDDNGIDDFSSVSAIYGRGELDLSSALSPVGNLTP